MISIKTTQTPATAENKKWLRVRFFTNVWLRIQKKNVESCHSRLGHSGSVATSVLHPWFVTVCRSGLLKLFAYVPLSIRYITSQFVIYYGVMVQLQKWNNGSQFSRNKLFCSRSQKLLYVGDGAGAWNLTSRSSTLFCTTWYNVASSFLLWHKSKGGHQLLLNILWKWLWLEFPVIHCDSSRVMPSLALRHTVYASDSESKHDPSNSTASEPGIPIL